MITISHLTKIFEGKGPRVTALEDVNLEIGKGDIYGIIGMSGAGKSTLLRCLTLLERPTSGQIMLAGQDIASLSGAQLRAARRGMGVVFQGYNLLMQKTVAENVAFPLRLEKGYDKAAVQARVAELLAIVGLEDRAGAYPAQLSGGQKQRVAIARALITKPKLVFADEPTGNLDSVSSAEVLGFLKRSVNELGQTIVMVTHDAVAASYADRAIVFADGQIVADEANPTAETMNELLMAERERATRTAVTSTRADTLARLAGVKDVPNLPITDAPLPPAGRTGTMRHARAAAQHAR